jgi:hypothetical protein
MCVRIKMVKSRRQQYEVQIGELTAKLAAIED